MSANPAKWVVKYNGGCGSEWRFWEPLWSSPWGSMMPVDKVCLLVKGHEGEHAAGVWRWEA